MVCEANIFTVSVEFIYASSRTFSFPIQLDMNLLKALPPALVAYRREALHLHSLVGVYLLSRFNFCSVRSCWTTTTTTTAGDTRWRRCLAGAVALG